jgi:diguanylate cyclase (GGDEF)-like protein
VTDSPDREVLAKQKSQPLEPGQPASLLRAGWRQDLAAPRRPWRVPLSPDLPLIGRLAWMQNACLIVAAVVGGTTLCGWLLPGIGSLLPHEWALMKANTALLTLLCAVSITLSRPVFRVRTRLYSSRRRLVSQICAGMVLLIAAMVLLEYSRGISIGIDTLLARDASSPVPGRMSPQTSSAFVLLGIILLFLRVTHHIGSLIVDFLLFCLCPLMMVIVSGYAFGVLQFFGVTAATRTAPQTLLVLILLTVVVFFRRAETGFYSVLTGTGIGSKIARVAAPLALLLPFVLETGRFGLSQSRLLSRPYATASTTAIAAVLGFLLVLVLSWHIDRQEQEIRSLSLRDDLTQLYNRRGFFLLAERELRLAQQSRVPISVIFLDLDGLKRINDTQGHESGSEFLKEIADLISQCFQDSDVVGRIGGDEFVIAFVAGETEAAQRLAQMQQAAADQNQQANRRYSLSYSAGSATLSIDEPETLDDLIKRADDAMYSVKMVKKSGRELRG